MVHYLMRVCITHTWMHIYLLFPCSSPSPFPPSSLYLSPFLLTVFLYTLSHSSPPSPPFLPFPFSSSPFSLSLLLPPSLHSFLHHPFLPFPSFLHHPYLLSLPPLSTDPYVKVYILHKGKKHDKWKSTIKRNTLLPIFNEPFQRL